MPFLFIILFFTPNAYAQCFDLMANLGTTARVEVEHELRRVSGMEGLPYDPFKAMASAVLQGSQPPTLSLLKTLHGLSNEVEMSDAQTADFRTLVKPYFHQAWVQAAETREQELTQKGHSYSDRTVAIYQLDRAYRGFWEKYFVDECCGRREYEMTLRRRISE